MKNVTVLLAALVTFTAGQAAAQQQEIRGLVVDDATNQPIEGAEVTLLDSVGVPFGQAVTAAGAFRIVVPEAGSFTLRISSLGFRTVEARSLTVRPGEVVEVDVRLGVNAIPLAPLRVSARSAAPRDRLAGFRERSSGAGAGAFGKFVTRGDIERHARMLTSELLRPLAGISLLRVATGDFGPERNLVFLTNHSGRNCQPAMYVDGARISQSTASTIDDLLSPSMLEGIEVYSVVAPPEYSGGACGTLLFWTRDQEPRPAGKSIGWAHLLAGFGGIAALLVLIF